MLNPDARVEVPVDELLDQARHLFQEVRVVPDRDRVVSMIDRLEWKINELSGDRNAELDANPESVLAVDLERLIERLVLARALLAVSAVFHPVELLSDQATAGEGNLLPDPIPDDGNIYVDGNPVAHSTLFDVN